MDTVSLIIKLTLWGLLVVCLVLLWLKFAKKSKAVGTSRLEQVQTNMKRHPLLAFLLFLGIGVGAVGNFLGGVDTIEAWIRRWLPKPETRVFSADEPLLGPLNLGSPDKDLKLSGVLITQGFPVTIKARNLTIEPEKGLIVTSFSKPSVLPPDKPTRNANGIHGGNDTGDSGKDGRPGFPGVSGLPGGNAASVRMEVTRTWRGHVTIENFGLPGQPGGPGGDAGNGGDGGRGKPSRSGIGFGGKGNCERGPGQGGDGGDGGRGGNGGQGGDGGSGGEVLITIGTFAEGSFALNTRGGEPGAGGDSGQPGQGGKAGAEGKLTDYCKSAKRVGKRGKDGVAGSPGSEGQPGLSGTITLIHGPANQPRRMHVTTIPLNIEPKDLATLAWQPYSETPKN